MNEAETLRRLAEVQQNIDDFDVRIQDLKDKMKLAREERAAAVKRLKQLIEESTTEELKF